MKVYVKLFAGLSSNVPQSILDRQPEPGNKKAPLEVELPRDSTLADLVTKLQLPDDQVKVTFVNGRRRKPDYCLSPEEEVSIFPPIGGG